MSRHRAPSIDQIAAARAQRMLLQKLKRPVPREVSEMADATPRTDDADDPAHREPAPDQADPAPAGDGSREDIPTVPPVRPAARDISAQVAGRVESVADKEPPSAPSEMNPETDQYRAPESLHRSLQYLEYLLGEAHAIVLEEDPERSIHADRSLRLYLTAISEITTAYWSIPEDTFSMARQSRQLEELHAQGVLTDEEFNQQIRRMRMEDEPRRVAAANLLRAAHEWASQRLLSEHEFELIQASIRQLMTAADIVEHHRGLQRAIFDAASERGDYDPSLVGGTIRTVDLPVSPATGAGAGAAADTEAEEAEASSGRHW